MLHLLWGLKTVALFDVWSIEHVLSGISLGRGVWDHHEKKVKKYPPTLHAKIRRHMDIIGVLFLAYLWETIEHYLESGLAGEHVEYWFQGIELWANRLITDPLLLVAGYYIATRYPRIVWPARIASLCWLFIHIFIFPHSMYLHEIFA